MELDLIGIIDIWWDSLHDCSIAGLHKPFTRDSPGRKGGGVTLDVKEQLEYVELCLGMDGEPAESLSQDQWAVEHG